MTRAVRAACAAIFAAAVVHAAAAAPPARGQLSGALRVDSFGWRPSDPKRAVLLGHAGVEVELIDLTTGAAAGHYRSSESLAVDPYSNDRYSLIDFTTANTPGDYYLSVPSLAIRSYPFRIATNVYAVAGAALAKAFYYQRCNHDKSLPHASDALPGYPGLGGQWVDAACHAGDGAARAGPGSADDGALDLRGGWHDAGDYQKTLWSRGVPQLLFAYEFNPGAWTDAQLNLPESGNGLPDLLDEARWELDFYLRMQRPDGHFLTSVKGKQGKILSPPSASDEARVYFDGTSPASHGWSGGGVTTATATANAVLALAHGAIVLRAIGEQKTGDNYAAAAIAGWRWLQTRPLRDDEKRLKIAAASAVFRLDPSIATARIAVESFAWRSFDGLIPAGKVTPGESVLTTAAWHCLLNPALSESTADEIRSAIARAIVEPAFAHDSPYAGLFGGPGNGWDWSWGSNRAQALYGANLHIAARFGVTGSHSAAELDSLARKHLHYLFGLNPLNMTYASNLAAYGAAHSSFQIYHSWFSFTGGDGEHGNARYNGKPRGAVEPLYPYSREDTQTSLFGPAPGLVVGGPNAYYTARLGPAERRFPAYAYRDFSLGCGWDGKACAAASWQLTEPSVFTQAAAVLLVSFSMPRQESAALR